MRLIAEGSGSEGNEEAAAEDDRLRAGAVAAYLDIFRRPMVSLVVLPPVLLQVRSFRRARKGAC